MHTEHTDVDRGGGFRSDQRNPYEEYEGKFTDFFDFGPQYRRWVEDCMLEALNIGAPGGIRYEAADVGAGSCFWAQRLLRRVPELRIMAVEPSPVLLGEQRVPMVGVDFDVSDRFDQEHATAQAFAAKCDRASSPYHGRFDCVYFMQSAHYIHYTAFPETVRGIRRSIRPGGRLLFQARNMSPDWWPWPFPNEWQDSIVDALQPLYGAADRYERQLVDLNLFGKVSKWSRSHEISVSADSYWHRLEKRWIPSVMSETQLSESRLREGIRGMRERYERAGRAHVSWTDIFTFVCAEVE